MTKSYDQSKASHGQVGSKSEPHEGLLASGYLHLSALRTCKLTASRPTMSFWFHSKSQAAVKGNGKLDVVVHHLSALFLQFKDCVIY
jgi:hypothetical protein